MTKSVPLIVFRVTPELKQEFKDAAAKAGLTLTAFIKRMFEEEKRRTA